LALCLKSFWSSFLIKWYLIKNGFRSKDHSPNESVSKLKCVVNKKNKKYTFKASRDFLLLQNAKLQTLRDRFGRKIILILKTFFLFHFCSKNVFVDGDNICQQQRSNWSTIIFQPENTVSIRRTQNVLEKCHHKKYRLTQQKNTVYCNIENKNEK